MSELKEKYRKCIDKKANYRFWRSFYCTIFGWAFRLIFPGRALGAENLPKDTGYILAFNHRSSMDIPVSFLAVPEYFRFVSKEDYYNHAFFRWLFPKFGVITLDREKPGISTIRKIVDVLKKGEIVGIYPEGTRNRDDDADMLEFKNGVALFALRAKVPVVPVYSYRKPRAFHKNYLYIGKPVYPADYDGPVTAEKISRFASAVRDASEEAKQRLCAIMETKSFRKEQKAECKRMKAAKKTAKKAAKAARLAAKKAAKEEKAAAKKAAREAKAKGAKPDQCK